MISKEYFVKLLEGEQSAYHFYDGLVRELTNEDIRKTIEGIRDDERRHVKMAERLLELAEKMF